MRRFLTWLSGADSEVLTYFPGDRAKYAALGGVMVCTGLVASASMWFALHTALGVDGIAAIPIAAAWGAIIVSVDRTLVVALQRQEKRGAYFTLAASRLLLALVLGLVVSTPITLQVFAPEIDKQISVIREADEASFLASQQHSSVQARVTQWQTTVNNLHQVIASGGAVPIDPASDPEVQSLTAQLNSERTSAATDYRAWQCQLYGGCGAPKGSGPLAAASEARYNQDEAQVTSLTGEIEARKKALQVSAGTSQQARLQQAQSALPGAQAQLDAATAVLDSLLNRFEASNSQTNGLLIRLQALDQLTNGDFNLWAMRTLLFLLFTIFEILPVLTKILQNLGKESAYDVGVRQFNNARKRVSARQAAARVADDERIARVKEDAWVQARQQIVAELSAAYVREWRDTVAPPAQTPAASPGRNPGRKRPRGSRRPGGRRFAAGRGWRPVPGGPVIPVPPGTESYLQEYDPAPAGNQNGSGPGAGTPKP